MPEWIPILAGLAALLTAIGAVYAHSKRSKNDMIDQLQEERNRLDAKLATSETKREADNTAMNARLDALTSTFNATALASQVKDIVIVIQDNHITVLEDRINLIDPPAPRRPTLPKVPDIPAP